MIDQEEINRMAAIDKAAEYKKRYQAEVMRHLDLIDKVAEEKIRQTNPEWLERRLK